MDKKIMIKLLLFFNFTMLDKRDTSIGYVKFKDISKKSKRQTCIVFEEKMI